MWYIKQGAMYLTAKGTWTWDKRMNEIDRFIDGLTHEQRNMIRDLLDDVRDETTFFGTEHD
jgi:hypothetical protein